MRRLFRILSLLVIVGGIAALAIYFFWGDFEKRYEFREESSSILAKLTGGEVTSEQAYDEASFLFQEASLLTSFVDRTDRLTSVLGRFEKIEKVEGVERLKSIRGETARVDYSVRFHNEQTNERVVTNVELSYLLNAKRRFKKDDWRLLGFNVSVPERLESKVKMVDSEFDRIKAPDEVLDLVGATLLAIDKGEEQEIRENASQPFKDSTTAERFAATIQRYRKELGPFRRRLSIHSSGQNAAKTRARVHMLLEFKNAKTSGNFEYIKSGDVWRLLHLKLVIPEPLFPVAAQAAEF